MNLVFVMSEGLAEACLLDELDITQNVEAGTEGFNDLAFGKNNRKRMLQTTGYPVN